MEGMNRIAPGVYVGKTAAGSKLKIQLDRRPGNTEHVWKLIVSGNPIMEGRYHVMHFVSKEDAMAYANRWRL